MPPDAQIFSELIGIAMLVSVLMCDLGFQKQEGRDRKKRIGEEGKEDLPAPSGKIIVSPLHAKGSSPSFVVTPRQSLFEISGCVPLQF